VSNSDAEKRSLKEMKISLALFVMALVPRIMGLNIFFTIDERPYTERGVKFLAAMLDGYLTHTYRGYQPAVTTMWGVALGIIGKYLAQLGTMLWGGQKGVVDIREFILSLPILPIDPDLLFAIRLPTVLIASLTVVGIYLLVRRIFNDKVALLGAALLAFDPFYLAHSRVVHMDALGASFMILAVLSFIVSLRRSHSQRYAPLAGFATGLACLTRSPSFFLFPFLPLMALIVYFYESGRRWKSNRERVWLLLRALGMWLAVAVLTFVLLWPAMWFDPLGVPARMVVEAIENARAPHHLHFNFFRGVTGPDPGPLFYPIVLLLRLTPMTLTGAAAAFLFLFRRERQGKSHQFEMGLLFLYVVGFTVFMALGASKVDRYLLSVFPAVDVLAGVGWVGLFGLVATRIGSAKWAKGRRIIYTLSLVIFGQAVFSLPFYPYYFPYYNPLAGGGSQATKTLMVGWGEGLDEAARYLNRKEGAKDLRIATWYNQQFAPFTVGHSASLDSWFSADYVVLYSSQVQRGLPETRMLDYFHSLRPEHVVSLKGIDYAWIYPVPERVPPEVLPLERLEPAPFGDSVLLLGYDLDDSRVQGGGEIRLTLYWQCLKPMEESYHIYLRLLNPVYRVWGEQSAPPLSPWGELSTNQWEAGLMYRDDRTIEFLPGTPPGVYRLGLSLYDPQHQRGLESAEGSEMILGLVEVPKGRPLPETLDIQHEMEADFGGVARLLGYSMTGDLQPGGEIHLTLFWQALAATDQDYTVFIHMVGEEGHVWGQGDSPPADGFYLTTEWEEGEIIRDQHGMTISPEAPAGAYRFDVGMYLVSTGERLPVLGKDGQVQGDKVSVGGGEMGR
jgi:hypothetical protein